VPLTSSATLVPRLLGKAPVNCYLVIPLSYVAWGLIVPTVGCAKLRQVDQRFPGSRGFWVLAASVIRSLGNDAASRHAHRGDCVRSAASLSSLDGQQNVRQAPGKARAGQYQSEFAIGGWFERVNKSIRGLE
jgi:hypothetical protein